jgi:nuclear receptor interaction protein
MASVVGERLAPVKSRIKKGKARDHPSLSYYLATRNWMPYNNVNLVNITRNHPPFLHRLNFMKKLPVHDGCVNTICWNKTGEYLLSGSDDCNLVITKPLNMFDSSKDYTVLHKVPTRHLGNIFCAQFIPNSGDQQMVSCSSEGPVIVHDINATDPSEGILNFNCHASTIHEVVTVPDDDKVFLSCGEDKTIRLFDMRVHNSCARSGTCPHPALIRNSHAMTTLNLHPLNSNLMLIGRADGLGLVYDRRKLPDVTKFSRERAHAERLAGISSQSEYRFKHPLEGVVAQFSVPDMDEKYRFTSLCYNETGTEVLASYSGDYVYLFNHDKSSNVELIQTLPKKLKESSSEVSSDNNGSQNSTNSNNHNGDGGRRGRGTPKISRIRVRGDWSDTGINSVPLNIRDRSDTRSNDRSSSGSPFSEHIAVTFGHRRTGDRSRFTPNIEIIAGPIATEHNLSRDESSNNESRPRQSERTIEEEDEDDGDGNSTVIDDDDDENVAESDDDDDADDDGDEFERFAEITVENSLTEAQEHHARLYDRGDELSREMNIEDEDDGGSSANSYGDRGRHNNHTRVSTQTKAKFKKTLDDLKNKYNHITSYKPRVKYQGHRNSRTSIKEAIFWGDDYIMSGSDCGRIMVWEKETAKIVMGFPADERVVNCLAPNPHHYVLASSGIDYDIKLWSTQSLKEGPLKVSDDEMKKIVDNNELMLEESKHTISVPPHLFFRVLASLVRSSR